jgi:hypothetical protein
MEWIESIFEMETGQIPLSPMLDRGGFPINLGSRPQERSHILHIPKILYSEEVKVSICK